MAGVVNKPDMNFGLWAENGNIEIPSSEKVGDGWVVEKPYNEQMNWLQNRQDTMLQYLNQRGVGEWDDKTTYPVNGYTARGGVVYQAQSQNISRDPTIYSDIWKVAFASYEAFIAVQLDVNKIKNEDGFLSLYMSKSDPRASNAIKAPAYKDLNDVSGLVFSGETPVILRDNNVVAQFSGNELDDDVVTFGRLKELLQTYKVGDLYLTTNSATPDVTLGYGVWERYGEGRALVGFSSSTSNSVPEWVKIAGSNFGNYDEKLTVAQMPSHRHSSSPFNMFSSRASDSGKGTVGGVDHEMMDIEYGVGEMSAVDWNLATEKSIGGDQAHNNVQPSIVVFVWRRKA